MNSNSTGIGVALLLIRLDLRLQIVSFVRLSYSFLLSLSHHNPRRVAEEIIHLLQRLTCGLGQQEPEEDRVGEVADDKEAVVPVSNLGHSDWRDLPDHCVEGERGHGRYTDTLGSRAGVEDFSGNDPR